VLAYVAAAIAEGLLREGLAMRPMQIAIVVALGGTLWFRRTNPLGATAVGFGLPIVVSMGEVLLGGPNISPYTAAFVLLLRSWWARTHHPRSARRCRG
jgi:hypothetical protein